MRSVSSPKIFAAAKMESSATGKSEIDTTSL
jgi:hypothetical protein